MSAFTSLKDIPPSPIWGGILARAVHGREASVAVVELAPNSVVAGHAHVNEQLGIVLRGSMRFTIAGETRDLVAGDMYNIPSNVPHDAVTGPEGAVVVDVFSPVREEWRAMAPLAPQPPIWP